MLGPATAGFDAPKRANPRPKLERRLKVPLTPVPKGPERPDQKASAVTERFGRDDEDGWSWVDFALLTPGCGILAEWDRKTLFLTLTRP